MTIVINNNNNNNIHEEGECEGLWQEWQEWQPTDY